MTEYELEQIRTSFETGDPWEVLLKSGQTLLAEVDRLNDLTDVLDNDATELRMAGVDQIREWNGDDAISRKAVLESLTKIQESTTNGWAADPGSTEHGLDIAIEWIKSWPSLGRLSEFGGTLPTDEQAKP